MLITRLFACALLCCAASAQAGPQDIGLTMDGGVLPVIYGQVCGPVTCQPFPAGTVPPGERRTLLHYSAPASPYAIAIGLQGPCTPIGGIGNALLLNPVVILAFGLTSTPPFVPTPCQQGVAFFQLVIPPTAPSGVVFRVQSLGISNSGQPALGPALEATVL